MPLRLAAERAVDDFIARESELLESPPHSLKPADFQRSVETRASGLTTTAGFLLNTMASIGSMPLQKRRLSAYTRYRQHRLNDR